MSMELYVLSDHQLASIDTWQRSINAGGFPIRLSADRPFAELSGALPVLFDGRQTAFECDHWPMDDLIETYTDMDFGGRWKYALAFRWGGDIYAGIAAYAAGGAYAKATNGMLLDCEEGKIISPQRAAEIARDLERGIPMIEAAMRRATERFRK